MTSVAFLFDVVDDLLGGDGRRRRRRVEETQIKVWSCVESDFRCHLMARITSQWPTQRPTQRPPHRLFNFKNVHFFLGFSANF